MIAPARLAYLSCNPATLWRDAAALAPLYHPRSATVFDMFPQTPHFETLLLLERR
jgi:tRNA/tmRNA/rRNA uracil-C5-methylase (TrmA/RlmC/RlmD family)